MFQPQDIVKVKSTTKVGVIHSVSDALAKPNFVEFDGNAVTREWYADDEIELVSRREESAPFGFVPHEPPM